MMLLWVPGCENRVEKDEHSQEYKEVYSLSDYDEETLSKIDSAYVRGRDRYETAQKKLQATDSVQRAQQVRNSKMKNANER